MMSHMGKPKGKVNPKLSLKQIVPNVSKALGVDVKFAPDCGNAEAEAAALKMGEALLLENLRFYPEEEGKPVGLEKGTPEYDAAKKEMKGRQKDFAKKLASYADVYVNDAFGTAHRKHASTAVIADSFDADNKMLGYLMEKEVKAIDNVLKNAQHPFTAIIGGSKVSSKLGVIKNLLDKVDNLIIGGGMGFTFFKAQGGHIGDSLHEDDRFSGLVFRDEVFRPMHMGLRLKAYVKQVRPDGKIDIALQKSGYGNVEDFAHVLLQHLRDNGGRTALGDKSPSQDIYDTFGVSKKVFKKAVGDLYKRRLIIITPDGLRLTRR